MRLSIELASEFGQCPTPWQNMIDHLQADSWLDVPDPLIEQELRKFDAAYVDNHLLFESQIGHMLWTLKWT